MKLSVMNTCKKMQKKLDILEDYSKIAKDIDDEL